jgi:AAA+ ATPase superfamily predicted ATPase
VRYEIGDNFLRFWFRYVARNQNLLQMGQNSHLNEIIKADYQTYSGLILEDWFRCKLAESGKYANIGAWWDNAKGAEQSEIDIVAIPIDKDAPIFVAEVKRQRKNYKPELLNAKVEQLRNKVLHNHPVTADVLTLGQM